MKKRTLFTTAIATLGILFASVIAPKYFVKNAKASSGNTPNCEELKANYPTISDILTTEYNNSNDGTTVYSTWGTVTAIYTQSSFYHAYIQNTVEGKESAALCLYKLAPTSGTCPVAVGDFVTVEGNLSYYNGTYEIVMNSASSKLTVHNDIEAYPVISETLSVDRLTARPGSSDWTKNLCTGNIRVSLENVEVVKAANSYTMVKVNGNSNQIKLYYGGIDNASDIFKSVTEHYAGGHNINVTGYLSAYDLKGKEETELLIRYASDIQTFAGHTPVTEVTFYDRELTLDIGETAFIRYDILPRNADNVNLIWTSSNSDVVSVMEDGYIIAKSAGYASIKGTSEDNPSCYGICGVTVEDPNNRPVEVESIEIDYPGTPDGYISGIPYFFVDIGDTGTLSYTIYPLNATNQDVWFGTNNPNVVDLNEYTGEWEIVGRGMAEIYVKSYSNYSVEGIFSVICTDGDNSDVMRVCFEEQEVTVGVGETIEVPIVIVPENCDMSQITYESLYGNFEILGIEDNKIIIKGKKATDYDCLNVYYPNEINDYAQIRVVVAASTNSNEVILKEIDVGSYNTNFGTEYLNDVGLKFAYYRAGKSSDGIKLYPSANLVRADNNSLPGSFSNETAKNAFTSIKVTYSGAGTLRYGETKDCTNSYALTSTSSDKTVTVNTNDAYFFYVEADKGETLDLIKLEFDSNTSKTFNSTITTNSRVNTRIPATVYSGTLTPGVSYVDVPTDITISGNSYTVKSTKRYTYYTFNYVKDHKDELNLNEIALTDPVDVANYFIAFHCAPVNYISMNGHELDDSVGVKSLGSQTDVQQMFGNKARYVSKYSKTSGYAIGIPYYGSTPTYLEFDFDGNGKYSLNSRDVCRVVLWASGWKGTGYGANIPVATYTDDHYVTFKEFNNYSRWNLPFDTKENGSYTQLRTNYYYGSTNTLTAK